MTADILVSLWLSFLLYSFVGWVYEEVLCSVSEKRFVNRGFLNGPYCPIYGTGALVAYLLLGALNHVNNPVILFVVSGAVCCAIEYATSFVMEKAFHARWWDYSNRFLNLNGRVCLAGGVLFGTACTVVVLFIQPALSSGLTAIPSSALYCVAGVTFGLFVLDLIVTDIGLMGFRNKVDEVCEQLTAKTQELYAVVADGDGPIAQQVKRIHSSRAADLYAHLRDALPEPVAVEDLVAPYAERFANRLNAQERRVMQAFPNLRIANSRDLAHALRSRIEQLRK